MELSTVFILTKQATERSQMHHTSIVHFLDLIDACGFDLKIGSNLPEFEQLSLYTLIFIDANICPLDELLTCELFSTFYKNRIVFFDMKNDREEKHDCKKIETQVLKLGARGIFYENDKLENMVKGIQQIKSGKFWFKRDVLETALEQLLSDLSHIKTRKNNGSHSSIILTKREYMIMVLIGQGSQNKEIAEQLYISVNTVKTHVYSIFRKTKCRNRVGLIQWSMQELKEV